MIQPPRTPTPDPVTPSRLNQGVISTAKGGSVIMIGRLFNYGCRFIITFILARSLGPEQYGMYNLAIIAATIGGGIALFGLDTTLMRYIAVMNSRKDRQGVWGAIQVGLSVPFLFSILISVILFALAYPIADKIFHEPRLAPLLQIASLFVPFFTMSDILAGATRGFKNMRDTTIAQNIAQPSIRLILILTLALLQLNVTQAIIAFGLADLCASLILLFFLNKRFSLKRSLSSARRDTVEILNFSLPLWLSNLMMTFGRQIQVLMIGSLGSIWGAGIFSVASQVNIFGNIVHASLGISARPLIAELHDQNRHKELAHLYQTATRWVVTLNLPFILIMVLFPYEVITLFGESFAEGATALSIMAIVNLVNVSTGMCAAILEMTGHTRLKLFNSAVRINVAFLANWLLIPRWGITGAALAALIQEVTANLLPLIQVWFLYRLLPYNRSITKPVLAMLMAAGTALAARLWLTGTTLVEIGLLVFLIMAVYAAVIQFLGLSTEEKLMVKRLRSRIGVLIFRNQESR